MGETLQQLQEKARQCQELADTAMTEEARLVLREIALQYEAEVVQATSGRKLERLADLSV